MTTSTFGQRGRKARRGVYALVVLLVATGLSSGAAVATSSPAKIKVAWLFYGPKDDGGYNVSQWRATEAAVKAKYGDRVQFVSVANVPYSSQASVVTEQVIRQGAHLVLDTIGAADLFTKVCGKYPEVACVEPQPQGPWPNGARALPENVSSVLHEFWYQEYLMGIAAGLMTKKNVIGFVAPYKVANVIASANAFLLGCQSVKPSCRERIVITNDYFGPPAATRAANTLVNAGADILHGWTDDPSFCRVAEQRGVRVIGQFLDYRKLCANTFVTSALWNFGPFFTREIELVLNDKWTGHRTTILKLGRGADIAPWGKGVPAAVKSAVAKRMREIQRGANPFAGPIYDQKGKLRVPKGKKLAPAFLYNQWSWFVKGVAGR